MVSLKIMKPLKRLQAKGYKFISETDTEALVHLVDDVRKTSHTSLTLEEAVDWHYAKLPCLWCCFHDSNTPDTLVGARHGLPMILGVVKMGMNFFYPPMQLLLLNIPIPLYI